MEDVRPEQQPEPDTVNPPGGVQTRLVVVAAVEIWAVQRRTYSATSKLKQRQRDRFIKR